MTEVQFASFGRVAASCSAAASTRRVSYGARRKAGPGAFPVELAVRQLKRRAASMGLAVVLRILHSLAGTSLLKIKIEEAAENVELPVRFDPHLSLEATTLVSRLVESWGTVPIALLQHIDAKEFLYGFIGLRDNFMHPLIPPGSFVQIDPLTKIRSKLWQSEYDRPIYFVDARDRYICGWCHLEDNHLMLIPHPLSRATVLKYRFPEDAEIVGQVVGVAARIDQRDTEIDAVG